MPRLPVFFTAAVALVMALAVSAQTDPALGAEKKISHIKAVIDFAAKDEKAADAFFGQLEAKRGEVIRLDLTILPEQNREAAGYSLKMTGKKDSQVLCGNGRYGNIDNYRAAYELHFQHPAHYHAPTEIRIGDRVAAPFNGLSCGVKDYTEKSLTPLHVTGYFVVVTADIPTARQTVLYPLRP